MIFVLIFDFFFLNLFLFFILVFYVFNIMVVLSIRFKELCLFLLIYADDLVFIFRNRLDNLYLYSTKCKLAVNTEKMQIVVFRNGLGGGGDVKTFEHWKYNNISIADKDQFCYLRIIFRYNNKFSFLQKYIADHVTLVVCFPMYRRAAKPKTIHNT